MKIAPRCLCLSAENSCCCTVERWEASEYQAESTIHIYPPNGCNFSFSFRQAVGVSAFPSAEEDAPSVSSLVTFFFNPFPLIFQLFLRSSTVAHLYARLTSGRVLFRSAGVCLCVRVTPQQQFRNGRIAPLSWNLMSQLVQRRMLLEMCQTQQLISARSSHTINSCWDWDSFMLWKNISFSIGKTHLTEGKYTIVFLFFYFCILSQMGFVLWSAESGFTAALSNICTYILLANFTQETF